MKEIFIFIFGILKSIYIFIAMGNYKQRTIAYFVSLKEGLIIARKKYSRIVKDYFIFLKSEGIGKDLIDIFAIEAIMSTWIGRKLMLTSPFFIFFVNMIN